MSKMDDAKRSVLRVGEGRGFVVEEPTPLIGRLIITAAHCLPFFPPCISFSDIRERTYRALLGPLGEEPTVSAECLFVDPIGDIAVLGSPDGQALYNECIAYKSLVDDAAALPIRDAPAGGPAWLLSLGGAWSRCAVKCVRNGPFWIEEANEGIMGGMSGSPIMVDDGSAIGIVCTSGGGADDDGDLDTEGGPNPRLMRNLPGWLLPGMRSRSLQSPNWRLLKIASDEQEPVLLDRAREGEGIDRRREDHARRCVQQGDQRIDLGAS